MRLTPLDLQSHRFARRLRGYDPLEVDAFMRMVAEDFEALVRERDALRQQLLELQGRVEELSGQEKMLRETLVTAQTLSEELKQTAVREAEVRMSETEVKAEKLLDAAHRRVAKLAEEIREMKLIRTRLAAAVRAAVETHLTLLEGLAEDPPEHPVLDGKVTFLTRGPERRGSEGGG